MEIARNFLKVTFVENGFVENNYDSETNPRIKKCYYAKLSTIIFN